MKLTGVVVAAGVLLAACADEETGAGGGDGTGLGGAGGAGTTSAVTSATTKSVSSTGASVATTSAGGGGSGGGSGGTCGDGETGPGEDCDDGNTDDGDGCSAICEFEPTGPDDVCPGEEIMLSPVVNELQLGSVASTTTAVLPHYGGSCGGSAAEAVFVVIPDVNGQITATLSSDYDAVLHARTACDDDATEVACEDGGLSAEPEVISVPASAGVPLYLFVDGYGGEQGNFTLDVEVATAVCGNGIAELPEKCDDGALLPGDGCSPSCQIEPGGLPDDCPGQTLVLASSDPLAVRHVGILGDTSSLATGISPTSCSGLGKQEIYGMVPDVDGHMTVQLVADYTDATLYVRGECDTSTTQLDCSEAVDPGTLLTITVPVFANNTYYVFVDGVSSTDDYGPYALDAWVTPGACGNNEVDGGEECDDGNGLAGDGCDACVLETPATSNDTCPGAPLVLDPTTLTAVVTASTASLAANWSGSGCLTGTTNYRDAVYTVTSPIDGHLALALDPYFDGGLYVRTVCTTTGATAQLGCVDAVDGNGNETLGVPIQANTPLYVFVDAASSTQFGVFELSAAVTPAQCGNLLVDGGEGCDDGNSLAGDGCANDCTLEPAGAEDTCPGEVLPLTQQGPDWVGSVYSGTSNLATGLTASGCTSSGRDGVFAVTAPIDGVLHAEVAQAAFNTTLYARSDCAVSASQLACSNANAGNGQESIGFPVSAGTTYYVIVDMVSSSATPGPFTLDVSIVPPVCGDGFVTGVEICDDGNNDPADGCAPDCTLESLAGNDVCPGYAIDLVGIGAETRTAVITNDTTPLISNYAGTCGGSSRDAVYALTSDIDGSLVAELIPAPGLAPVLYAREDCTDVVTEISCDDTSSSGWKVSTPVSAGTPIYLFIDGLNGEFGVSTLNITVTP
jgi:cysteine-rich repeat protein